eukprot:4420558-Amphidinium_carterae.1
MPEQIRFEEAYRGFCDFSQREGEEEQMPNIAADELQGIAKRMRNTSAGGDGIPTKLFKVFPTRVWYTIAGLFNQHLEY